MRITAFPKYFNETLSLSQKSFDTKSLKMFLSFADFRASRSAILLYSSQEPFKVLVINCPHFTGLATLWNSDRTKDALWWHVITLAVDVSGGDEMSQGANCARRTNAADFGLQIQLAPLVSWQPFCDRPPVIRCLVRIPQTACFATKLYRTLIRSAGQR